ncbi:MAG: hypothetical protein ACREC0_06025 [Methylocella sp.]
MVQLLERCKCSRGIDAGSVTRNSFPFRLELEGEHVARDTADILKVKGSAHHQPGKLGYQQPTENNFVQNDTTSYISEMDASLCFCRMHLAF